MASFNLLADPWIPCLRHNGAVARLGALDALADAESIRDVAASNPMDRLAVIRFLLALVYWCRGNPENDPANTAGTLPGPWFDKARDHMESFALFGDGPRFFQAKDSKARTITANYLFQEIPTGTNLAHFRHTRDGRDGLCPACCALGLVRLPLFTTQGGAGKSPGINGKPPIYAIRLGGSLLETLKLNWLPVGSIGRPSWAGVASPNGLGPVVPLLTGLTHVPRRVWLSDPTASGDRCLGCGQPGALVREMVFAGLGSSKPSPGSVAPQWDEPFALHPSPSTRAPVAHGLDPFAKTRADGHGRWASQWAGMVSLGAAKQTRRAQVPPAAQPPSDRTDQSQQLWIVSFATDQAAYYDVTEYCMEVPPTADGQVDLERQAERWRQEGNRIAARAASASGRPAKHRNSDVLAAVGAVRDAIEAEVGRGVASATALDWSAFAGRYRGLMQAIGQSLAPGVTSVALRSKDGLGRIAPAMDIPSAKAHAPSAPTVGGT